MSNLSTLKQFRNKEAVYQKQYRVGEDVLIMFASKDQIYVRNLVTDNMRLYHRGLQLKGTYRKWKLFRQLLKYRRNLTDQDVYHLGFRYEIDLMGVYKRPILDESYKKVGVR